MYIFPLVTESKQHTLISAIHNHVTHRYPSFRWPALQTKLDQILSLNYDDCL